MSTMSKSRRALIGLGLAAATLFGTACQVNPPSNATLVQDDATHQGRASILGLRKIGYTSAGRLNTWCGPKVREGDSVTGQMCESSVGGGLIIGREAFAINSQFMNVGAWSGAGQICGGRVDYRVPEGVSINPLTGAYEKKLTCT